MGKKIILIVASIVVVLLLAYGYQTMNDKKAPDIGNFIEGITCAKVGNAITITSAENAKCVLIFNNEGTELKGFYFYQAPANISSRSIPIDLLNFAIKYKYLVDFAKQCFFDTSLQ